MLSVERTASAMQNISLFPETLMAWDLQSVLITAAILLLGASLLQSWQRNRYLPPGPRGLPIFGVLPKMGKTPYLTIQKWWHQYGDVFSMYMGSRLVVVINGLDAMKECFLQKGERFNGRPWNYFKKITNGTGLVFTEGAVWQEHRRFTLRCLRDLGMGKGVMEEKIALEARYLVNEISQELGKPADIGRHIPKAVSNIISSLIYGDRFEYDDKVFQANLDALDSSFRKQTLMGLVNFLPILEFMPKLMKTDKILANNLKLRDDYAREQMKLHSETYDAENPRDYIDAYVSRMHQLQAEKKETTFEERQLQRCIQDLFIAGTETISTSLKWAFLFMVCYPEVQKKVQEELDLVVGSGRQPTMKDRDELPYTYATLMECQRAGNIALFSVPRVASQDTTINGHLVPKGAWVFINRWGMHASDRYWDKPEVFNPLRFLDEKNEVVYPEAFVPFGVGPRSCMGENIAKMELFIFFTSVLQNFTLSLPEGESFPSLTPRYGINMSPETYYACAHQR